MKEFELLIPKTLLMEFKDSCNNKMLECEVISSTLNNSFIKIYRRSGKELSIQTVFDLGRVFESMVYDLK